MKLKTLLLATTVLAIAARSGAGEDNSKAVTDALAKLDVKNDQHWTADGLPRIDTVKALTGDATITRAAIEQASPGFNREKAGGENRPGSGVPAAPSGEQGSDPVGAALLADGWQPHPTSSDYSYRGEEVRLTSELATEYAAKSAPSGGGQTADQPSDQAQDISGQTGMGGAMTARSPEPVEGELRRTHVELESQGAPGERPIGITQGATDQGVNQLGTPEGTVVNAGRDIELSGEVAARSAGSVMTPTQAPADSSNSETISLGGAADPAVEARAPGGAVVAEGAAPATFFEGDTVGGPFGHSGITASDGSGQAKLGSMDSDFPGDPDAVNALEAQLEDASARSEELRGQVDDLSTQLNESLRTEAQLRRQIEANRPRSGTMDTIQSFLRSSQERRAASVREGRK